MSEFDQESVCDVCGEPMVWVKVLGWVCRTCDDD